MGLTYRWRTGRSFAPTGARAGAFPMRDVLVLGSNGYLGTNLASALDAARVVLSSRAERADAQIDAPFVRADLARSDTPLSVVDPREVYVLSRPTGDFEEQARFCAVLKSVLHRWAGRRLERIVFASTQLVYATPADERPLHASTPLSPVHAYEYFKSELEHFLRWLASRHPGLDVETVRLPLLHGGIVRDRRRQLLPSWIDRLRSGARFDLETEDDRRYGNSWVHVPDLVKALPHPRGPGFHVRQPVSGHFTYAALQAAVKAPVRSDEVIRPPRSTFFLEDEEGLPRRELLVAEARRYLLRTHVFGRANV